MDGWTDACLHTYSTCETFLRASILDLRIDTCTACGLACHVAHVWHVCVTYAYSFRDRCVAAADVYRRMGG